MGLKHLKFKRFTIFFLIPLILSIGLTSSISFFELIQEAEGAPAIGPKAVKSYGSKNSIVCGDRLCSEDESTPPSSSSNEEVSNDFQRFLQIKGDPVTNGIIKYHVVVSGQISHGPHANPPWDMLSTDGTTIDGTILPTGLDDYNFTGNIVSISADQNVFSFVDGEEVFLTLSGIPKWIKYNAGWWVNDQITDDEFLRVIKFLVENGIIEIEDTSEKKSNLSFDYANKALIPKWIKNNAGWWANDQTTDDEFLKAIKSLIEIEIFEFEDTSEKKPNIVLVMTDDVSVLMIDFLLEKNLMPNLQRHVIDKGTTFTNSFVSSPICCPSRATILTGLYPHNHEILANTAIIINGTTVVKGAFQYFIDTSTVATWLHKEGYNTGYFGKYMNGYAGKKITYVPPGWVEWKVQVDSSNTMLNFTINDNGHQIPIDGVYKTDYLANEASNFIKNSKSNFFLYVSTLAAHGTWDGTACEISEGKLSKRSILVSSKYKDSIKNFQFPYMPSFNVTDVDDKSQLRTTPITNTDCIELHFQERVESLRSVDDLIGTIYEALADTGQVDDTVFLFYSDNGYQFGEHQIFGKLTHYEESIRVPFYARVPGVEKQTIEHLVINNDLPLTIADLAGAEPDFSTNGLSLVPIIKDPSNNLREDFLVESYMHSGIFFHVLRGQDFSYVEYSGKSWTNDNEYYFTEYYDLVSDPYQLENLAADCNEEKCIKKLEELSLRLDELKKE